MTLMVNGKKVVGYALGGTEFYSIGKNANADGSISLNGQDYLSKNNMKLKDTGSFHISLGASDSGEYSASPVDVTNELSNYGGYLAICIIYDYSDKVSTVSQPITIPAASSTYNDLTFDSSSWGGKLSMDSSSSTLTFTPQYNNVNSSADETYGHFYILSNN